MHKEKMKPLLLLLTAFIALKSHAFSIKAGDLILQSNSCYLCNLIEKEEASPYSHMGVFVFDEGVLKVMEAWGTSVRLSTLGEFVGRRKKNSQSLVLRNKALPNVKFNSHSLLELFRNSFEGKSYDAQFLWSNYDEKGEKLYCSEFAVKFLAHFYDEQVAPKPMHFEMNRELWMKFFHGNPPDGLPGLSPGDFERSPLYRRVGYL